MSSAKSKESTKPGTLIKELDIALSKTLVGGLTLRAGLLWISNSEWAMLRARVSNPSIFSCQCCLKRDTGTNGIAELEDYAILALYRNDAVMERWAHTEEHVSVSGIDYTRFQSDNAQIAYLRRDHVDAMGIVYAYGDDPEHGLWDAPHLGDATILLAAKIEPGQARLRLKDTLAISSIIETDHLPSEEGSAENDAMRHDEIEAALAMRAGADADLTSAGGSEQGKGSSKPTKGKAKAKKRGEVGFAEASARTYKSRFEIVYKKNPITADLTRDHAEGLHRITIRGEGIGAEGELIIFPNLSEVPNDDEAGLAEAIKRIATKAIKNYSAE